ncbi:acyltransferase [Stenotrophomonas sp. Iso1]|uniref:acyltransferase n=1 Tax=Stenotrophomonas sp. Iso1 TaxID=2977283 RepID=UPI0022B7D630|nr:acyltransferase [Stenotrophomonas sp. Iso1]
MVWLRVALVLPLVAINTVVHCLPLFVVALVKAALPFQAVRRACNPLLTGLAESWIGVNSALIQLFTRTRFEVSGLADLDRDGHYLVLANHQSWVDILVLQKVFNRRIPLLRFFLKRSLFWVPMLGLAWWALDFPFMGRYTRKQIVKNPELGRRDMEVTRKACEKFNSIPVAVMNFVEGTRFTQEKHDGQGSPFKYLLKPKSGGVAFVLDAMGKGLHALLDVTIVYPKGIPSMIDLMANRLPEVRVLVRKLPIPAELVGGNYQDDRTYRAQFQQWMNSLWVQKDAEIAAMLEGKS